MLSVRKGTPQRERVRNSLVLNYKSAASGRLSYDANVIYVVLSDILTFVLAPFVHRSPLERSLPMKIGNGGRGGICPMCCPSAACGTQNAITNANRIREVLGRNC